MQPTEQSESPESPSKKGDSYGVSELWNDIVGSIKGTEYDFTKGSIGRAILILSVPMVLEMSMESIFAIVDIFFVSQLGPEAIATVGLTESMLTIIYAIAIGLSMATTAIISRRIGEKNKEGAAISAVQSILVGIFIYLPISALGIYYSEDLLLLMGASDAIIENYSGYTTVMLVSNSVIMLLFIINAVFRGAGDAAISMRVLWAANILNIILDPLFIFGIGPFPELGVTGAAVATTIGRGLGVIYQFYLLSRKNNRISVSREHLKIDMPVMNRLFRLSIGGIGQYLIATSSWIGLVRIIAEFGSEALAGYTIAIRIVIFSLLPSWGMSNAAATLVGQNLGAEKPDRAEKSVWITALFNMVILVLIGVLLFLFSADLVRLFSNEKAVIEIGSQCLQVICFGYLFYSWGMIMVQAFNGSGDTFTPTLLNFICFWIIEIPLAYYLAMSLGYEEFGVFLSIVIAESLLGVLGVLMFRRGTWKLRKV